MPKGRKEGFPRGAALLQVEDSHGLPRRRRSDPQSVEPHAGSEFSFRIRSPKVKRYSCSTTREDLHGNLYEVRKDKEHCCQEPPVGSGVPKARKPSQSQQGPAAIISGHLGTWLLTSKQAHLFYQAGVPGLGPRSTAVLFPGKPWSSTRPHTGP